MKIFLILWSKRNKRYETTIATLVQPIIFILLLTSCSPVAQTTRVTQDDPPPGSIKLLPGYQHRRGRGIDTQVGTIRKTGGITINYDIGGLAGLYVSPDKKDQYAWYKEQTINNQSVRIALTPQRQLTVTFVEASANFMGTVPTDSDLADALLMLLTYNSRG